jgi:hypothetical protein
MIDNGIMDTNRWALEGEIIEDQADTHYAK